MREQKIKQVREAIKARDWWTVDRMLNERRVWMETRYQDGSVSGDIPGSWKHGTQAIETGIERSEFYFGEQERQMLRTEAENQKKLDEENKQKILVEKLAREKVLKLQEKERQRALKLAQERTLHQQKEGIKLLTNEEENFRCLIERGAFDITSLIQSRIDSVKATLANRRPDEKIEDIHKLFSDAKAEIERDIQTIFSCYQNQINKDEIEKLKQDAILHIDGELTKFITAEINKKICAIISLYFHDTRNNKNILVSHLQASIIQKIATLTTDDALRNALCTIATPCVSLSLAYNECKKDLKNCEQDGERGRLLFSKEFEIKARNKFRAENTNDKKLEWLKARLNYLYCKQDTNSLKKRVEIKNMVDYIELIQSDIANEKTGVISKKLSKTRFAKNGELGRIRERIKEIRDAYQEEALQEKTLAVKSA